MRLQKFTFALALVLTNIFCYSQEQEYFVVKSDTTFCSNLDFSNTTQGYLSSLKYTDKNGENIAIKGRKNVPDVSTLYWRGEFIDKIPLKASKPNSYVRFTRRTVNGKLKVYLESQRPRDNNGAIIPSPSGVYTRRGSTVTTYKFNIKLDNGTYYKINSKKNMKKYIKPYLLKCNEFKQKYSGEFSTEPVDFIKMIRLYNSLCE